MIDCGFPIIEYERDKSPRAWGEMHGELYREAIRELFEIRLKLMREKNETLSADVITRLAAAQWDATKRFAPDLAEELEGICSGSGMSSEEIVVVNNYTDFRDIQLADQGCSLVFVNRAEGPIAGQTWDMHRSAKYYVCCIRVPGVAADGSETSSVVFSLVGCVGMMGYVSNGNMIGVNNINTDGAMPGALWPVVVRNLLQQADQPAMANGLKAAPVTSGHNYLVADSDVGEMWEAMPGLSQQVGRLETSNHGDLFHTNHCLGEQAKHRETAISMNSTTEIRYELIEKKIGNVSSFDDVYALLNDHENYPKAICSNFQSSAQDPSATCGGAVGDLASGRVTMWRGDEMYDDNFVRHDFQLKP